MYAIKPKTEFISLGVTVALSAVILMSLPYLNLGPNAIAEQMQNGNSLYLMLGITLILMIISAVTPLPAEAVTLANGMVFGPLLGALVSWISAMLGALVGLWWGRKSLQKVNDRLQQMESWQGVRKLIDRWGTLGFLSARLFPAVPFFLLNIGAAILPISTRRYLVITGLAILPHILLICLIGGHLAHY